ncbi:uncharacterized protein FFE2_08579 [Fusarium fujikuroi]|uniref:Uncharacterized protein n=1 Tax=Fusarium fujikuroi TaxID=5127 RepID=A0A9Q9UCE7_FUSFU|nr:uncharacterized protein FFE2_08579 [Fusarium fujikuroi]VTT74590.1 unnamed protein product [Fusarium fujikuroi]
MSEFGDIPSVVIDTAIGELPDQRKAATIRRWLVQAHEKATDKEREAYNKERQAAQALQEFESQRSRLEEMEKDLESRKAALDLEHTRIAGVAERLPSGLSKTLEGASAAMNQTMGSTSESIEALKNEVGEVTKNASGIRDLVSALPSRSTLEEWANSQDQGRFQSIRAFISESMEKLKAQDTSEQSAELEQLRIKYETQSHEVSKLEGEKKALDKEVQSLGNRDRESLIVITNLQADRSSRDQTISTLEGEKESLQQELESLRSSDSGKAVELNQLRSRCRVMEQEVSTLRKDKTSLGAEVELLRSSERESSSKLGDLRAECSAKSQAIADLQGEKEVSEHKLQKLRELHGESVKMSAQLEAQLSASEQEVRKLEQRNQDLVGKADGLQTENSKLLQDVSHLQTQRVSLEEKAQGFNSLSEEHEETRKLLQDANVEIGVLHNRIKRREDECERNSKWREEVREENTAARDALNAKETYIRDLESRITLTEAEQEELVAARSRLQILEPELGHVRELLEQETDARIRSEQDRETLNQNIVQVTQDMSSWNGRYTSLSETHAKAEEALGKQLDAAHRDLGEQWSKNEELQTQLTTVTRELGAKDLEMANIEGQLATLQRELQDERRRVDEVENVGENVKSILETLESTQRLRKELSDTKSLLKEAEERLIAQQAIGQGFTSELAKMYSILAESLSDLPTAPGSNGSFRMHYVATRIAPLLIVPGAKDNLEAFLRRKSSNWHCFEQVVSTGPSHGDVGQGKCSKHVTGCILVCVVSYGGEDLLMFRER